ncbi:MAG TPA: hypothetical protein VMS76_05430 [Planctomycetota bacterium]|nr:hypothetical protein [Planctomycetota bacterium]
MLQEYQDVIRDHVRGRRGVYALYRRDKLYYVGLAENLRGRLRHHLRDRHGDSWDRFSVYITIDESHLRELESLVLRIVQPKGNKQKGRFARSQNLLNGMLRLVREQQRLELTKLFGRRGKQVADRRVGRRATAADAPELARYVREPMRLRGRYKGRWFRGRVRRDGTIRFDGKVYRSPTGAAKAVVKRACSGWSFWECERAPGDWIRLAELRQ